MQSIVKRKTIQFIEACGLKDVNVLGATPSEVFGTARDRRNGNSLIETIESSGGKLVKKTPNEVWLDFMGGLVQVQKFKRDFMFHLYADVEVAKQSNKTLAF